MTNFIATSQIQGICDEEPDKSKARCSNDSDCQKLGSFISSWNGIKYIKNIKIKYN